MQSFQSLVNYVVNIADNLTLYIKNFEKTLETYLGSNLASEVIIKIDEMVVKYVNSIEAIDPIADTWDFSLKQEVRLLQLF